MSLLYFAYGSNLWVPRLRERVPGAEPLGPARLPGFALRWHKRSQDGSGKCSIVPEAQSVVHGGLFRIPRAERPRLDRVEELGTGYGDEGVEVESIHGPRRAYTYVALAAVRDDGLKPYAWYRDLVVAGAAGHDVPSAYLAALRSVSTDRDPDPGRAAGHRASLRRPWPRP